MAISAAPATIRALARSRLEDPMRPRLLAAVLAAVLVCAPFARAQDATEEASVQGTKQGLASSAFYYTCSGLLPAYNAVTTALDLFGTVNKIGFTGEMIVEKALGGAAHNATAFKGRIPDYITPSAWVEVKNTNTLGVTRQIRETAALARANGKIYTIITRVNTKLSSRLMRAMASGSLRIIKCLPEILQGQM
jgi:Restriction endonuclease fold toxin 7